MSTQGNVNITLTLKNHLTGPLAKAQASLDKLKKSAEEQIRISKKAAYQASREGREFEKLAKAQNIYFDAQTRRWKQGTKFIAASKVEALRLRAHARAVADLQTRMSRFANTYNKLQGFLSQGAIGAARRARQWQRIVGVYTAGAQKVTAAHTRMVVRTNMALGRLQGAWAKTTQRITQAQSRLVFTLNAGLGRVQGNFTRLHRTATGTWNGFLHHGGRAWRATTRGLAAVSAAALAADKDLVRLGKQMSKPVKHGWAAAGLGVGLAAGAAGWMGMTRINQMQAADVKLDVMGEDEASRKSIIDMVDRTVRGTFVTLGEGMTMATQQMGAGVEAKNLEDRVKTITDLSALYAPTDAGRVSMITAQIQAKGRLTGEEALQLGELGAPVYDWVAQDLGIQKSQVADVIASGKYTSDQFFAAMAPRIAGGAKKMGETFLGSWMLLKAAVARSGEAFLLPLLEPLRTGMLETVRWLDSLKEWFGQLGSYLGQGLGAVVAKLPRLWMMLEPLGLALKMLFASFIVALPGLMDGLINFIGAVSTVAIPVLGALSAALVVLSPYMGALIPAFLGLAHAALGLFVLYKVIKTLERMREGMRYLAQTTGQVRTALVGTGRQATRTQGIFGRLATTVRGFAGRHGLGQMNTQLNTAGTRLQRMGRMAGRAALGVAGLATAIATTALANIGAPEIDAGALSTALTEGTVDQANNQFKNAKYRAGEDTFWGRFGNSGFGILGSDSIGGAIAAKENANIFTRLANGIAGWFTETPREQMIAGIKQVDTDLSMMWRDEETRPKAMEVYSRILSDAAAAKDPLDESAVLSHMPEFKALKEANGFFSGGFTGTGPTTAPAGIVHGQEFVTNAWATRNLEAQVPGGLAAANATGQWPTGATFAPTLQITVGSTAQAHEVAAAVRAELERQARKMSRHYMTPQLRGAR